MFQKNKTSQNEINRYFLEKNNYFLTLFSPFKSKGFLEKITFCFIFLRIRSKDFGENIVYLYFSSATCLGIMSDK